MATTFIRSAFAALTISACGILGNALFAPAAHADATFIWNFSGYNANGSAGNQLTFYASNAPTEAILARSYATTNTDGTGAFQAATTTLWSGGIGIKAPGESNETSSPNHAIDNDGKDNFLLLEFDSDYHRLTQFGIGWYSGDADVQIWVGGPQSAGLNLTTACGGACSVSQLTSLGFTQLPVFNNVQNDADLTIDVSTNVLGRYVLVAGKVGDSNDYFKLDTISNTEVTIAEPGTIALSVVGLAALWGARRRRRTA